MFIATLAIAVSFRSPVLLKRRNPVADVVFGGGAYRILWFIGYGTALMTAFYMFRLMYLTFFSPSRMSHDVEHHVHESPKSMTVPLVILAICSIGADGWVGRIAWADRSLREISGAVFAREAVVLVEEGKSAQLAAAKKNPSTRITRVCADVLVAGGGRRGFAMARRSY